MKSYKDIYRHHQDQLQKEKAKKSVLSGPSSYYNNSKKSPL